MNDTWQWIRMNHKFDILYPCLMFIFNEDIILKDYILCCSGFLKDNIIWLYPWCFSIYQFSWDHVDFCVVYTCRWIWHNFLLKKNMGNIFGLLDGFKGIASTQLFPWVNKNIYWEMFLKPFDQQLLQWGIFQNYLYWGGWEAFYF